VSARDARPPWTTSQIHGAPRSRAYWGNVNNAEVGVFDSRGLQSALAQRGFPEDRGLQTNSPLSKGMEPMGPLQIILILHPTLPVQVGSILVRDDVQKKHEVERLTAESRRFLVLGS
jgi:hypothetical protein